MRPKIAAVSIVTVPNNTSWEYLSLLTRQRRIVETTTINEYLLLCICKKCTVLGLIPEKVEVGNKKQAKNTRKDRNFSPLRFFKSVPTYTHLSLLMFFRAGVPIPNWRRRPGNVPNTKSLESGLVGGFSRGVVWYSSSDTVTIDFNSLVRVGSVYRNCTKQHLLRMYQRKCVRYCSVKIRLGAVLMCV